MSQILLTHLYIARDLGYILTRAANNALLNIFKFPPPHIMNSFFVFKVC